VQLSLAPEPGGGTFTAANLSSGPIPRFILSPPATGPFTSITLCQTSLLYPFITGASGFDTGIAVANTSMDPFKTVTQTGSCTLYGYGLNATPAAIQPVVPGCDQISNPISGTNCFPVVQPGTVGSVQASAVLTNFTGYVIAICNFQYAHGYAALTDLGLRNLWSSYLALELGTTAGFGSPRVGVSSIEELIH
jgi:hypothetical protein